MGHFFRFFFGTPQRIITTIVVLLLLRYVPGLAMMVVDVVRGLVMPVLAPVLLIGIALFALARMTGFGRRGGGHH